MGATPSRIDPIHILVVEDDPDTKEIISRVLLRRGYQVTIAPEMESGLSIVTHGHFKCVVSDIFMKGMGGIEGIHKIRTLFPDIKILAISAGYSQMSSDATLRAAEKIGADMVLPKPFQINDLADAVDALMGIEREGDKADD
ncbi:MAG: response regulator [Alphaproteobacteria bacterium]